MNDLKFAFRQLVKNPGFTAVAVLTLALGIGANTAIFSVVDQLLVRPLPVPQPDRLALLGQLNDRGGADFHFNYPLFRDYQTGNLVFENLSATAPMSVGVGTSGTTERRQALLVSGSYFAMLGVNAALGRTFAPDEGVEIDDAAVVVLSHGLWQRSFGADPQVIGRTVRINAKPFTVIGVTPREFTGTTRTGSPELYVPIASYGQLTAHRPGGVHPLQQRYFTWTMIMGRLKDGVSREQAQAAMNLLAQQIHAETPANTSTNLGVLPGALGFTDELRPARLPLSLLLGTAALVLLIACANLANLQLARATSRLRDFAIRLALGANRRRLIRELLTESLLLSLIGGAVGLAVAVGLVEWLERFRPTNTNIALSNGLDLRVLLFAFGASVFTGMMFGLAPAWRASRPRVVPELKGGAGTTTERSGRWTLRQALVVTQVALSLLVLVSAGLCVRSLQKLQAIDPAFEPSQLALMSFDLELNDYQQPQARAFYEQLLERVRTLPGIEAASLSANTPLSGRSWGMSVERVEGFERAPDAPPPWGELNMVSPGYFGTLGIPLLRGREFNATDAAGGPPVVIVNDAFAQRYFAGADPVGKHVYQHVPEGDPSGGLPTEIIGMVQTTRSGQLTDSPRPAMFFSVTQKPELALTLAVRTGVDSGATITQLRGVVKSLDANVPVFDVRTLAQQKNSSLSMQRMAATLLSGFGALALLLAALGIYGVLAYSVGRRTREIGVRMALGAQLADVLRLVMRQGMSMVILGLVLGLAGALVVTRLLRSFLFEIQPFDPLTFGVVVALLSVAAAVACWLPARRAARVDPMVALRSE
jgi:predicted permease